MAGVQVSTERRRVEVLVVRRSAWVVKVVKAEVGGLVVMLRGGMQASTVHLQGLRGVVACLV